MPRPAPDFAGTLRPEIQNRGQSRQSPLQERFVDGSKLAEAGRRPVLAIRQFIAENGHFRLRVERLRMKRLDVAPNGAHQKQNGGIIWGNCTR